MMRREMRTAWRAAGARRREPVGVSGCAWSLAVALSFVLCVTTHALLAVSATAQPALGGVGVKVTTAGSTNSNLKVSPYHGLAPTSSPFVSAAAAAALGGLSLGPIGLRSTHKPDVTVVKVVTDNHAEPTAVKSQVVSQSAKASSGNIHKSTPVAAGLHKHSNKVIHSSDRLHKFDLYIDPVCEQINKLTDKQLSKVYQQLRQFSQITSGGLARCFKDHGFHLDLTTLLLAQQHQQVRLGRDNLANFCSARNLANEPYKQFGSCAGKSWLAAVDAEIDRILKDRLHGNRASGKAGLTNTEMSLIDDIVAHLHEEQVQEIANELAQEQKNLANASSTPLPTTTATTTTTSRVLPLAGLGAKGNTHQSVGKLIISSPPAGAAGPSVAFDSNKSSRDERNGPSAKFTVQVQHASSSPQSGLSSAASAPTTPVPQLLQSSSSIKQVNKSNNNNVNINVNKNDLSLNTLIGRDNLKITLATTLKPNPPPQTPLPVTSNSKFDVQVQGSGGNNLLLRDKLKSGPITVTLASDIKIAATTRRPLAPSTIILLTNTNKLSASTTARPAAASTTIRPIASTTRGSTLVKALEVIKDASAQLAGTSLQKQPAASSSSLAQVAPQATPVNNVFAPGKPTPLPVGPAVIPPPPPATTSTTTTTTTTTSVSSQQSQKVSSGASASASVLASGPLSSWTTIAPTITPLANMLLNSVHLSTPAPAMKTTLVPLPAATSAPFFPPGASAAAAASAVSGTGTGPAAAAAAAAASTNLPPPTGAPISNVASSSAAASANSLPSNNPAFPPSQAPIGSTPPLNQSLVSSSSTSSNFQQVSQTTNTTSVSPVAPVGLTNPAPPPALLASPPAPLPPVAGPAGSQGSGNAALATDVATTKAGAINATATGTHVSAQGAPLQPVVAKAASQAVTAPAKIEPAVLINVDKALDIINGVTSTTPKPLVTTMAPRQAAMLQALGSAFLKHTLAEREEAETVIKVGTTKPPTSSTTSARPQTSSAAPTTRAPTNASTSVVISSADKRVEAVTRKEVDEHELMSSKGKSDASVEVHDVIVVGEHVDGDDLVHDHDEHHEEVSATAGSGSSDGNKDKGESHAHHDVKGTKMRIHHDDVAPVGSSAKKEEKREDRAEKSKKEEEGTNDSHADHAHLLKGLKVGDVVHVEAGQLDVKSAGSE